MIIKKPICGWCIHWGYVTREYEDVDGQMIQYTPHFDRRHNVNVVFSYVTGQKKRMGVWIKMEPGHRIPFYTSTGLL